VSLGPVKEPVASIYYYYYYYHHHHYYYYYYYLYSITFFENRGSYEIMQKNGTEPVRPPMT
jgi:hypothetical protein